MTKLARDAGNVLVYRATWGGSQNFLGAGWVAGVVDNAPVPARESVALRLLALSPHYFYDRDVRCEHARNRRSRQILADAVVGPTSRPIPASSTTGAVPATWPRRWPGRPRT